VPSFDPLLASADPTAQDNLALLLERLDDPTTTAQLLDLLDHVDTLSGLLTLIESLIARSEAILDNVTSSARQLAAGLQVDPGLADAAAGAAHLGRQAVPLVSKVGATDVVARLAASPATDEAALGTLMDIADGLGTAAQDAAANPPQRRWTLLGLRQLTRDPDFNRGLDFLLRAIQETGHALGRSPSWSGGAELDEAAATGSAGFDKLNHREELNQHREELNHREDDDYDFEAHY
jgi:hypothetical protein